MFNNIHIIRALKLSGREPAMMLDGSLLRRQLTFYVLGRTKKCFIGRIGRQEPTNAQRAKLIYLLSRMESS